MSACVLVCLCMCVHKLNRCHNSQHHVLLYTTAYIELHNPHTQCAFCFLCSKTRVRLLKNSMKFSYVPNLRARHLSVMLSATLAENERIDKKTIYCILKVLIAQLEQMKTVQLEWIVTRNQLAREVKKHKKIKQITIKCKK